MLRPAEVNVERGINVAIDVRAVYGSDMPEQLSREPPHARRVRPVVPMPQTDRTA